MSDAVLQFESVCFDTISDQMTSVKDLSFRLEAGNVLMLHTDADTEHAPIIDLGLGLASPDCGEVRFMGSSWSDMDAFGEAANRGRIGCMFEKPSWIGNLSVLENIKLRERHHTRRDEDSITEELFKLVEDLGITDFGDIHLRPHLVSQRRLRVYEWVRASMGNPVAMLMSFPERGAPSYALEQLINHVKRMAKLDTAVLWMTDRDDIFDHNELNKLQIRIENQKRNNNETKI